MIVEIVPISILILDKYINICSKFFLENSKNRAKNVVKQRKRM